MIYRTSNCTKFNHPEIGFELEADNPISPQWLLDYLEEAVAKQSSFTDGQIIQIGSNLLMTRLNADESIELLEPDFKKKRAKWVAGVDRTLKHLAIQNSVCKELGVEGEDTFLRHCGVCSPCFKKSESVTFDREEEDMSFSGWFFKSLNYSKPRAKYVSLYEICVIQPIVIPFLSLPVGFSVRSTPSKVEVICTETGTVVASSEDNDVLNDVMYFKGIHVK